jgi:hypothetical protein
LTKVVAADSKLDPARVREAVNAFDKAAASLLIGKSPGHRAGVFVFMSSRLVPDVPT